MSADPSSAQEPRDLADISGSFVMAWEDWQALQAAYMKLTRWRRYSVWLLRALIVACVLAGLWFVQTDEVLGGAFIGYAIVLLALKYVVAPYMQKRTYRRSGLADAKVTVRIGENGVTYATPLSNAELAWPMIRRFSRAEGHSFFWLNSRQAFIVPDRAFAHATDPDAVAAIANRNLVEQPI